MRVSSRFTAQGALAVTLCWVLALAIAGSTDALLFLAPALLIVIPLLGGHYVGEGLIAKLAARRAGPRRAASTSSRPLAQVPATWVARGSRLIAFSLAKRPPPAVFLPQN